jgi:hypothetical protein
LVVFSTIDYKKYWLQNGSPNAANFWSPIVRTADCAHFALQKPSFGLNFSSRPVFKVSGTLYLRILNCFCIIFLGSRIIKIVYSRALQRSIKLTWRLRNEF